MQGNSNDRSFSDAFVAHGRLRFSRFQFYYDAVERLVADVLHDVNHGFVEAGLVGDDVAQHLGLAVGPLLEFGRVQLDDDALAVRVAVLMTTAAVVLRPA